MKRIDIFGVPGSGKTTIYKALRKKKKTAGWCTADEALQDIYRKHFRKESYGIQDYVSHFVSFFLPLKNLVPVSAGAYKEFISEKIGSKDPILEHYFGTLQRETGTSPYMKARRMEFLVSALEDLVLLEHYCEKEAVVCDESLSGRLFLFVLETLHAGPDELAAAVSKLSPPDGYIFLDADPAVIQKRILSRDRLTMHHRGLTNEEIFEDIVKTRKKYHIGHQVLMKRNIYGLIIDTLNPLDDNIALIEEYLKQISSI